MRILIIDGMNALFRAYHSYKHLQNHGKPVSVIYGMPILINGLINQFKPDKIYICWDGKKSIHRIRILPTYKHGRKTMTAEERAEFIKQRDTVMKVFYYLGIPQLYSTNMEADDWIYILVRKLKKDNGNKITIVSTDKDFHQLIRSNVKIYNTVQRSLIHKENLKIRFGYTPKNCVDFLCLTGDKSDNIPGVKGVGDSSAQNVLNSFSSIPEFLSSHKNLPRVNKTELAAIYERNRQLIDLRYFYNTFLKGKIKLVYYGFEENPKLDKKNLFKLCDDYEIKGFKKPEFLKNYK